MRALPRLAAALLIASAALAAPPMTPSPLTAMGRGVAIVFSPDLSLENNCAFYERLGFVCYATPSWEEVADDIDRRNAAARPEEAISVVILEAHGTQGNGLKLQTSSARKARRSYAAVGALRERLGAAGVRDVVLAACNSRRLLRPAIHDRLDRERLYLPATLGIMNAAGTGDPGPRFLARADSHIESISVGRTNELSPPTLRALGLANDTPMTFVVSDMLIQLVTGDPSLDLREATPVNRLKLITPEDAYAEDLFARFVEHLHRLATSEAAAEAPLIAALERL
ncbi:MAG TPA: hypothetical protein VHK90_00715 [Thermoanaerobaculia bacterium]|nr:hypothetical protein [Thermoanaerobaculia bacterium]